MTLNSSRVIQLLKKCERFKPNIHYCLANKRTIGYGYDIDINPLHLTVFELDTFTSKGITEPAATSLLIDMAYKIKYALDRAIPWWACIGQPRRDALIGLAYKVGISKLLGYKDFLSMLENTDYESASKEALKFEQVEELARLILRGKYSDD